MRLLGSNLERDILNILHRGDLLFNKGIFKKVVAILSRNSAPFRDPTKHFSSFCPGTHISENPLV